MTKFLIETVIVFLYICKIGAPLANPSTDLIISKAIEQVNPHHLTVYLQKNLTQKNLRNHAWLGKFMKQVPVTIVDNIYQPHKNDYFLYEKSIASTLHIISIQESTNNSLSISFVESIFRIIRSSIFYTSRPKILIILDSSSALIENSKTVLAALHLAWQYKFLDFTVLQITPKKNVKIINYNPFINQLAVKNGSDSNIILFPDNLKDVNGYGIRVGVRSCWPNCNETGVYGMKRQEQTYKEFNYFANSINATTNYIVQKNFVIEPSLLIEQNLNLVLFTNFLSNLNNLNKIMINRYLNVVAVVPVINQRELALSVNMFVCFVAIFSVIVVYLITARLMNLILPNSEWITDWTGFNIFQMILGLQVKFKRLNSKQKILYLTIFCLDRKSVV